MLDDDLLKIKTYATANRKLEARREAEKYAFLAVGQETAAKNVTSSGGTDIPDLATETSGFSLAGIRLAQKGRPNSNLGSSEKKAPAIAIVCRSGRRLAAPVAGEREMLKRFVHNVKSNYSADPGALGIVIVATLGLWLLIAESTVLYAHGIRDVAVCLIAILAASTVSSIAGFAFSALSGAFLFHIMESPVDAVQVMVVCSIAIQLLSVAALWCSIDWRSLPIYLAGGIAGVPAGVYLLLHLRTGAYRDVIGGLLISYGAYLLLRYPARPLRTGRLWDAFAGFLGGLTGGLAAFPGAFVTIWCGMKGWDKARQRGVYQPFILSMQPVTLIAIYLMRPSSPAVALDWKTLVFVPAALLGAWFGLRIFKRLSDRQFEFAVCSMLISSGIGLIV